MNAKAMEPFGRALLAYLGGDPRTEFIVRAPHSNLKDFRGFTACGKLSPHN